MNTQASRTVTPAERVAGTLHVPGDKSLSHRGALFGAIAGGVSRLSGFLPSEDCLHTLAAVEALGAGVERRDTEVTIQGASGRLRDPGGTLDLGNSGTGMRLLAGALAGQPLRVRLTGDASLRSRPMGRVREPLERMGARVVFEGPGDRAPMSIHGGGLRPIHYASPVASAQVKSCVLLAGLAAPGTTTVSEPRPSRDHTERLLKAMGAAIEVEGPTVRITGAADGLPRLNPLGFAIPGDFSSAAFWLAAAAVRAGSEVTVSGVGLNPGRTALLDVLRRMGAQVEVRAEEEAVEARGSVTVRGGVLRATEVGGDEIPRLIDELPLVAVLGAMAEGRTVIRDARELRVKESDRIATTADGLRAMGVEAEEREDGLAVAGPAAVRGGVAVDSGGDHRIAMAMSVLALCADAPVEVLHTACIGTSYPRFWQDLAALTGGDPGRKGGR